MIIPLIEEFLHNSICQKKPPLLVILGPTASGKTALSLKIAQKYNGEIISADSRQLYKGMNIATDKVNREIRMKVPHHLIDIINPDETITLFEYKKLAEQAILEINKRKRLPILVGGTGLYIQAITQNYKIPETANNKEIRTKLETDLSKYGQDYLYKKLKQLDRRSADKIDPRNHRYLIRAIEINLLTGKNKQDKKGKTQYYTLKIGIEWPRDILYKRINDRVDEQIKRGLVEETRNLLSKYPQNIPSMTALGYKQIIKHLNNELPLESAIELLKKETRNYARRQLTWFRRDNEIMWLHGEEIFDKIQ